MSQLISLEALITKALIYAIVNRYLPTGFYKKKILKGFYDKVFLSILTAFPPVTKHAVFI